MFRGKYGISALAIGLAIALSGCAATVPTSDTSDETDAGIDILGDFDRLIVSSPDAFIRLYESQLGKEGYVSLPELLAAAEHIQSVDASWDDVENF